MVVLRLKWTLRLTTLLRLTITVRDVVDLRLMSRVKSGGRAVAALVAVVGLGVAGTASFTGRYRVRAGDSLSAIAARAGVSVDELAARNHIADANRIFVGQAIDIGATAGGGAGAGSGAGVGSGAPSAVPSGSAYPLQLQRHPERLALLPSFGRWAGASAVPADLLEAMCWMESGWQNTVVSSSGAIGIGQLEPSTVRFVSAGLLGIALNPHRPHDNIRMTAAYLRWLLDRNHGNVSLALGSYYQGLGSVRRRGLMPETRRYVRVIELLRPLFG